MKKLSIIIPVYNVENYISKNKEELLEYEINSAKNIFTKKETIMEKKDIAFYLKKKGYSNESIELAQE